MTDYLVRLSQHSPGAPASGWVPADEVAVTGSISCRPYAPDIHAARIHAEGPDRIILPEPFSVRLVNGECTLHLRPTDAWWCWEVREQVDNGRIRHLTVVDSALVLDYAKDAVDVDPTTLAPAASAVPAWTAAVEAVQGYADAAAASEAAAETAQGLAEDARDAAQALTDVTVTTGAVVGDNLVLTRTDLTTVNAGNVRGPQGTTGAAGPANTLAIGTVTTGAAGSSAAATITGAAPSQTLDLTIPRGDTGMPSSLVDAKGDLLAGSANDTVVRLPVGSTGALLTPDSGAASGLRWTTRLTLEGSGSPLGVVSAPVGSVYYDTAGTTGAWVWLKTSGTGNTGWVVTVGDTGWRRLYHQVSGGSHTLAPGWSCAAGSFISIRRVNGLVSLRLTGALTYPGAPLTLRPVFNEAIPAGFLAYYTMGLMRTTIPVGAAGFGLSLGGATLSADCAGASSTTFAYGAATWDTPDTWPATLPGVPV